MSGAVILENIVFRHPGGKAGIFDLSMQIAPGELVVCIGPSGCGKTTLLRLIAGFLRPGSGRVLLNGIDATNTPVRERKLGIVFQSYALFPHMSVRDNIAYPLRVRGAAAEVRRAAAERMLGVVGLEAFGDRLPAQLSGGQQQRVALARALVFEPAALLLDEPLSALDAATRVAMRDEVRRVQRSLNIATLLITHDQDEALSLADRIVVLREGRMVQAGTPRSIYDAPADAFVAGFVGRANLIDGETAGPELVKTAFGLLATPAHGRAAGERVRLLVRPERVESVAAPDGENTFAVEVRVDRFFGSSRHLDVDIGGARLRLETHERAEVRYARVPREAIQFVGSED